jgi:hypothetical protein
MLKLILKSSLFFFILIVFVVLSGMTLNLKSDKISNQSLNLDTLKTEKNHKLILADGESIKFSLDYEESLYDKSNQYFKINDTIGVRTADYSFIFNDWEFIELHGNLRENKKLIIPKELNLYNSTSNTQDIISLMDYTIAQLSEPIFPIWLGMKNSDLFHNLMKNKITREICYSSIKQNYELFNSQITVFQKKMFLSEIGNLINFCANYNLNRKKYLNGKLSISEKPEDFGYEYGYETWNEGFLFRRIEFDGVQPSELAQFLKEFKIIIFNSMNSSDYNSNMSCDINGGKLKVNSYANSKNKLGFLLRTRNNNESYFVPSQDMKITKLEIKGKDFWRILYDEEKVFITLDENLKKV